MPVNVDDPTIPVACAVVSVPTLNADACAPELNYGPITNAYITQSPFLVTATATEFARRLALATTAPTDPEAMVLLICTMSFGSANTAFEEFNGKQYPKPALRAFPIETKDTNPLNYEFARQTQRGGYSGRVYGVSGDGKYLYGGLNGIQGTLVLNNELATDLTGVNTIKGALSFKGFFDPKRVSSPIPAV